jgi:hypothetical protein
MSKGVITACPRRGIGIAAFLLICGLRVVTVYGAAPPAPSSPPEAATRVIRVRVLDLRGRGAPGRKVHLVGISRESMRTYPDPGDPPEPNWDFVTDREGYFQVILSESKTMENPDGRPGWGTYCLVVEAAGMDAGAVSKYFFAAGEGEPKPDDAAEEWGPMFEVPTGGQNLILPVQKGITLQGHIWNVDHPGHPLVGIEVSVHTDVHVRSHTGYGGQIFECAGRTNADGDFTIEGIYPATFVVNLFPGFWLQTKSGGRWKKDALDEITPDPGERVVHLQIKGSAELSFLYSGRVVDDDHNQPIPDATVSFGMSYHRHPSTYSDEHHFPSATTDSKGNYRILLGTPWVRGMNAKALGFADSEGWSASDETKFPPGTYNFRLSRDPAVLPLVRDSPDPAHPAGSPPAH